MARIQEDMASKSVEASSGGGMVKAVVNGKQELLSISIDPEIARTEDIDMLQDLVVAAVNEALRKSKELMSAEMGKLTAGLGIPEGLL